MVSQHTLTPGTRLENFEVGNVLGIGGFGITYKGYDHSLDCDVAIKEYLPGDLAVRVANGSTVTPKSEDDKKVYQYGLDRFLDEARTLAKFKDPNIVRVTRFLKMNGTAYIIMDYEEGEPLSRHLKKNKNISEEDLLHIFLPILNGLRSIHAKNILHRDIKPSNIYLRQIGTPVLLDFGAARQALGDHSRTFTSIISPGFAPFEQYNSREAQGPWTDLYGVGASLYYCVTKKLPAPAIDRYVAHQADDADPLISAQDICNGQYSMPFLSAIDWMVSLRIVDRPQTVENVIEVLTDADTEEADKARTIINKMEIKTTVVVDKTNGIAWDATYLDETEKELAQYIGPLARVLVQQAAEKNSNTVMFIKELTDAIPSEKQRQEFQKKSKQRVSSRSMKEIMSGQMPSVGKSMQSHKDNLELPEKQEHALTKLLAQNIGPLAHTIVARELTHAKKIEDLLQRLATEIDGEDSRLEFLSSAKKLLLN